MMAAKSLPASSLKEIEPHYVGHRTRLKKRFVEAPHALADYEILELLLCLAQPRRDTKPTAKKLLDTFSSLGAVLHAPTTKLQTLSQIGSTTCTMLALVRELLARVMREELEQKTLFESSEQVVTYCQTLMQHLDVEQFRVLFLNNKGALLSDEVQQHGTIDEAPVYPREVIKRALDLGATAFIVVHNHPSGHTTPSRADRDVTDKLKRAAIEMDLRLIDHLIVGKYGFFSFKAEGLL